MGQRADGSDTALVGDLDFVARVSEDAQLYYVTVEVKIPKGWPVDLTYGNVSRCAAALKDGLKR